MKTKKIAILSIFIALLSLTSCNFDFFFGSETDSTPYPSEEEESTPQNANYYRADRSIDTYYTVGQHSAYGQTHPKTLGQAKTLVVPIAIKGYESTANETTRSKIQKAFFGTSNETGWESVSTYFNKASFGQFELKGEVTPWYNSNLSPREIAAKEDSKYGDGGTYYLLEKVYSWLSTQGYNLKDYDLDNDGYIDSIWMIYGCPNGSNSVLVPTDTFWAFSFVAYNFMNDKDVNKPVPNTYAWASYDFMDEGKSVGIEIDAHTYIHETGHVLGLDDYYDYDSVHSPLGAIDMQDNNVGDHNAYSKMALGWSRPYVVTGDCTITIKPAESSGQCILLRDPSSPYNGNAFSEYLLLELLTPTGLWKQDATKAYPSIRSKTFTQPGVRLMHVDSRLIDYNNNFVTKTSSRNLYSVAYSNTPSDSYSSGTSSLRDDLIALIPANNDTIFQSSANRDAVATNASLFSTGDKFTINDYSSFFRNNQLHDGTTIPFEVTFDSVTSESATITFKVI